MCTLTVVTGENSYRLAMNRDERIARGAGLPPETRELNGVKAAYPTDAAGGISIAGTSAAGTSIAGTSTAGTWLAANDRGIALALLNWNLVPAPAMNSEGARSRGLVIPGLIPCRSLAEVRAAISNMDLSGVLPFRLMGIFPGERQLWEWGWNSFEIGPQTHGWAWRHWFSSSLSDDQAEQVRGSTCRAAWSQPDAGSEMWLRTLHASHENGPGAFSLCVHRDDVRTLSYSEVVCTEAEVCFRHFRGSPCSISSPSGQNQPIVATSFERRASGD